MDGVALTFVRKREECGSNARLELNARLNFLSHIPREKMHKRCFKFGTIALFSIGYSLSDLGTSNEDYPLSYLVTRSANKHLHHIAGQKLGSIENAFAYR